MTWKRRIGSILIDLCIACIVIGAVWVINYKLPHRMTADGQQNQTAQQDQTEIQIPDAEEQGPETAAKNSIGTQMQTGNFKEKFADQFTARIVDTADSYTSPDLAIHISHQSYDSGRLDTTDQRHVKYGTKIAYTVADIYVSDVTCLQTAFAQDTYGIGYEEKLTSMAKRLGSKLAVNGDSYSNDHNKEKGTVIRNGIYYRVGQSDAETCVLNLDGTMDIYAPGTVDRKVLEEKGAYQSWVFGPSLLDENGKAKTEFVTWDYIRQSHPRTAIGYYEPGHYCLVQVDGRQSSTRGMFPEEMAKLFESLGCQKAYNLDGGHCSFMVKDTAVENHPYKPEHGVADGIFIMEQGGLDL